MSASRASVAKEALTSLDDLIGSTLQLLGAYQTAGGTKEDLLLLKPEASSSGPVQAGAAQLVSAKERQTVALQQLSAHLQQLALTVDPTLPGKLAWLAENKLF